MNYTYKSFLPIFPGFYNTIYEFDNERILEDINESRRENNLNDNVCFNNLEINYDQYEKDISIALCDEIKNLLSLFVIDVKFERVYSPKEYNFKNDSINVQYILNTPNIYNIHFFINEHKNEFKTYLKENYTSCDGFIPYYSNDFKIWKKDTKNFTDFSMNEHYLGSILQFISNILEIDHLNLFYNVIDQIWNGNYIINYEEVTTKFVCNNCGKIINDESITKKAIQYHNIMKKHSKILCIDCLEEYYIN